jgi:hypothetical protein
MKFYQEVKNNPAYTDAYINDDKCYGSVPTPSETWRIIGGNVNGLGPFGDMASLITVTKIL